ncbi:carbonic anhydrase [Nocardioides sp.]|uniref:carbonic anhydrase n=1 Tax=Nocardioides sp. TaxID=35761 RepID=UPI002CA0ACB5|nr:carbonic anhydrase [Nocardioides sp.]HXH81226.1 carbonic anhydrase [Nocardioides sp.]
MSLLASDELMVRSSQRSERLRLLSHSTEPALKAVVLTCADHRVDPAHVLGLEPNDAVVLRNPGGRVTGDVVRSLLVLSAVAAVEQLSGGVEIIVMHHTDCGMSRLGGPEHRGLLADYLGTTADGLAEVPVIDPALSLRHDVAALRALVGTTPVIGLLFDVGSGTVHRLE